MKRAKIFDCYFIFKSCPESESVLSKALSLTPYTLVELKIGRFFTWPHSFAPPLAYPRGVRSTKFVLSNTLGIFDTPHFGRGQNREVHFCPTTLPCPFGGQIFKIHKDSESTLSTTLHLKTYEGVEVTPNNPEGLAKGKAKGRGKNELHYFDLYQSVGYYK